jgi:hypothetical protein
MTEVLNEQYKKLVKDACGDCFLYEERDPNNAQEKIDCDRCREALKEGMIDMRAVGRYSKTRILRASEVTVWDQVLRPRRKFGERGRNYIDYATYTKLRGKIQM